MASERKCECKLDMLPTPLSEPDSLRAGVGGGAGASLAANAANAATAGTGNGGSSGNSMENDYDSLVRSVVQDFSIVAEVLRYIYDARKVLTDRLEPNIVQLEMAEIRAETALRRSSLARQKIAMIRGWRDIPNDDDTMKRVSMAEQKKDNNASGSGKGSGGDSGERTLTRRITKEEVTDNNGIRLDNKLFTESPQSSGDEEARQASRQAQVQAPRCPFASMGPSAMPEGHPPVNVEEPEENEQTNNVEAPSEDDPIAAVGNGSQSGSVTGAGTTAPHASKCPIRYLDQHSPEELAKYFEEHKHEIPRSHQLCVKRYQNNEESIRKLDAKYGNLVSMIQGLGSKHQAFLSHPKIMQPNPETYEDPPMQDTDRQKMQDWAVEVADNRNAADGEPLRRREETKSWEAEAEEKLKSVSSDSENGEDERTESDKETQRRKQKRQRQQDADAKKKEDDVENDEYEERENQFDRKWKEVRLGESPSRPWGIAVPESVESITPSPNPKSSADTTGLLSKRPSQSPAERKEDEKDESPVAGTEKRRKSRRISGVNGNPLEVGKQLQQRNTSEEASSVASVIVSSSSSSVSSELSSYKTSSLSTALVEACNVYFSDWKKKDDAYLLARQEWMHNFENWQRAEGSLSKAGTGTGTDGGPPHPPQPPQAPQSTALTGDTQTTTSLPIRRKVIERGEKLRQPKSSKRSQAHRQKSGGGDEVTSPIQIVITGPVFFGYGAKETERLVNATK